MLAGRVQHGKAALRKIWLPITPENGLRYRCARRERRVAKVRTRNDTSACVCYVETKARYVEAGEWTRSGAAMDVGERDADER